MGRSQQYFKRMKKSLRLRKSLNVLTSYEKKLLCTIKYEKGKKLIKLICKTFGLIKPSLFVNIAGEYREIGFIFVLSVASFFLSEIHANANIVKIQRVGCEKLQEKSEAGIRTPLQISWKQAATRYGLPLAYRSFYDMTLSQ